MSNPSFCGGKTMARHHILTAALFATSLGLGWVPQRVLGVDSTPTVAPTLEDATRETVAQTLNGYTLLHVNPTAGDDRNGDGGQMRPFKTITYALQVAAPSTIIVLSPGLYTEASGETFPIQLRAGVTLQGTPTPNTANVVIQGSAAYLTPSQGLRHITLLGTDQAGLANVTVSNPHPQGHGLWIESGSPVIVQNAFVRSGSTGIYIAGNGSPVIQGNYFFENGDAGLIVNGLSSAQIQDNVFESTGVGISVAPAATPLIVGNQISYNREGLVLHAEARPQLRNNQILNNRRNSVLDYSPWPSATPTSTVVAAAIAPPPTTTAPVAAPPETVTAAPVANTAATATAGPEVAAATRPESAPLPPLEIAAPASPTFEPLTVEPSPSVVPTEITVASPVSPTLAPAATLPALPDNAVSIAVEVPVPPNSASPVATSPPAITVENPNSADDLRARLRQRLSDRADGAVVPAPATAEPGIAIAVIPAPEPDPEVAAVPLPTPSAAPRGPISSNILIVPGQNIPIGNGGSATAILATGLTAEDGPPPPPSRATILGLYYRVFVDANDDTSRAQLEALVPDAFQVRVNGQPTMQAGAFNTLAEAQATSDRLNQAGLRARVEYIP
ncbi:MAG: DUF1565 domain-containing protein [Cyanobacteria bacterium]|nr:DUF1565 domain-containing protein [Cyanobacteriota bacterium]MDA0865803.1 DUF1565 domain-containing protein [Cyanobacteriota bacterium]